MVVVVAEAEAAAAVVVVCFLGTAGGRAWFSAASPGR